MLYRREVLPLRKIISDETLLRYNAMQIDVFALLAEARQRTLATTTAIEAQRDFWLAATDLRAAVVGGCDVAEMCTGTSAFCPSDVVAPSSVQCRAVAAGGCDVAVAVSEI